MNGQYGDTCLGTWRFTGFENRQQVLQNQLQWVKQYICSLELLVHTIYLLVPERKCRRARGSKRKDERTQNMQESMIDTTSLF